jgi:beta-aspartyl-peptidase (threonine type)
MKKFAIAIHGGAGTITRNNMTPEKEKEYKSGLENAIREGIRTLENGGTSLEAIQVAIVLLENNPLFNAGRGAVFTHHGKHEMDASVMEGKSLRAGAVAGIRQIKNPIELAFAVMNNSEHVLLSGEGAMEFARKNNFKEEPEDYFFVQHRYDQWQMALKSDQIILDHTEDQEKKFGTVGAVALDIYGNLAAGTSTGGMTNKKHGRIGDTPIIGSGTYANNNTCAISCTGHGEFFIRAVVAHDISCLMEYKGLSLREACETVVQDKLVKLGGEGGLIAIDKEGNIELPFNSEGMYRASMKQGEDLQILIYKD